MVCGTLSIGVTIGRQSLSFSPALLNKLLERVIVSRAVSDVFPFIPILSCDKGVSDVCICTNLQTKKMEIRRVLSKKINFGANSGCMYALSLF